MTVRGGSSVRARSGHALMTQVLAAPRLLTSRRFSRAYVIYYPSLLLPGLSACPSATSSKIIPRISREVSDWPLRPELAAVLGGWLLSQLTEGVGDSSCLLLSGVVAVLACCIVTARTLQGWPAPGPGRLPPGPCLLAGVSAETPGSSVTSRVRSPGTLTCAHCPAVTVALEAGGADTHTQRAIPGSEPSQDTCTFPRRG